jgi:uncharacterized membrane protein YhaH (DUF805 family)
MSTTATPAGFYPDPLDPGALRYWDGFTWTDHQAPLYLQVAMAIPPDPLNIEGGRRFVTPFRALFLGFRQYVNFRGRASRSEYWWWTMWTNIATVGVVSIFIIEGASRGFGTRPECTSLNDGFRNTCESSGVFWTGVALSIAFIVLLIAMVLPTLAVLVRRLHDGGFSGLLALLLLGGFIAGVLINIAIWVLACFPTKEANKYGPPPTKGKPRRSEASVKNDHEIRYS